MWCWTNKICMNVYERVLWSVSWHTALQIRKGIEFHDQICSIYYPSPLGWNKRTKKITNSTLNKGKASVFAVLINIIVLSHRNNDVDDPFKLPRRNKKRNRCVVGLLLTWVEYDREGSLSFHYSRNTRGCGQVCPRLCVCIRNASVITLL